MRSLRRIPLLVVLAATVVLIGVVSSLNAAVIPSSLPSALTSSVAIESTALYCTGLTSAKYGAVGHVTLINTTSQTRDVVVDVSSDKGLKWTTHFTIPRYSSRTVNPGNEVAGDSFGMTALISGGGVVGLSSTSAQGAVAPCISTGEKTWYAAGFDTRVGSDAALNIYNPTATPAVMNVTTYSPSGFSAPPPFQGLSVGPHAQIRLDLGTQVVAMANVGVRVNVLRGVVDVVGVQRSGPRVSFNTGAEQEVTDVQLPRVTTANSALAQVLISNPGAVAATVRLRVTLAPYKVNPLVATIGAFSTGVIAITPNPTIPAAGYASVHLTSNQPVSVALATGVASGTSLSSVGVTSKSYVIDDVYGHGYDASALTNVSTRRLTVVATFLRGAGQAPVSRSATLQGDTTQGFQSLFGQSLKGVNVILRSSQPSLQVTLTLPTKPTGTILIEALDGR
ncbi:MAG: hypothetical protein HKL86_03885 [Acidimicrobiaceae bacterium]|nr:hypothetical protein [Acidimicrobiaceae bacterium]